MRHSVNPKQIQLFDPDISGYSAVALRRLREDWPGVFRNGILELMPVDLVEDRFHECMGRPTKELYSMCGLVFLMEFRDWTADEAADAYMFDSRVHFALNLGHDQLSMTTRTIERYRALFREEDCAAAIMDRVTRHLVDLLGVSVERQRLDSTHVLSNMAIFGRTRLMLTVVRRFLTQLKRHETESFAALSEELRMRYEKKNWEFGASRGCQVTREQVAGDMLLLISRFEHEPRVRNRTTFQDLVRVFHEQCELVGGKVAIRKKPETTVMQNPSDPDASYDGYKGAGYQVQVSETCGDDNEVQLVVAALPQTASDHDQNAVEKMLDLLEEAGRKPEVLLADSGYGSDENHCRCTERKVGLVSPVNKGGRKKGHFRLDDFELAPDNTVLRCPIGRTPVRSKYDESKGKGTVSFTADTCEACCHLSRCPVYRHTLKFRMQYEEKDLRLMQRRCRFETAAGREEYAMRSGIEGTFSRGKTVTGLGKLRVRGMASVSMALLLKLAGLNVLRAAQSEKLRKRVTEAVMGVGIRPHFQFLNLFAGHLAGVRAA